MSVKPLINMLCSDISHMALLFVWQHSGVTRKHGFDLNVHISAMEVPGQPMIQMSDRAPKLLDGTYDFLSGLHHETYIYRARGDRRFAYLAQAQNDWDDRVVARADIRSPKDLEGQKVIVADRAPCVFGNLKHSLQVAGANLDAIEFVSLDSLSPDVSHQAVEAVARGEAAAASVDIPFDRQGEKLGLHYLPIPSVPVIHNATMCANRDWVVENEETTVAFLKSMIDTIHFYKREKSRVCEILERSLAPIIGIQSADEI